MKKIKIEQLKKGDIVRMEMPFEYSNRKEYLVFGKVTSATSRGTYYYPFPEDVDYNERRKYQTRYCLQDHLDDEDSILLLTQEDVDLINLQS